MTTTRAGIVLRHIRGLAARPATDDRLLLDRFLGGRDEPVQRLSERYRVPLVLCYLEGRTRDEAARELGWSLGTLKRRLDEARQRLRARLDRRGLALPAVLLAAGLGAAVPEALAA